MFGHFFTMTGLDVDLAILRGLSLGFIYNFPYFPSLSRFPFLEGRRSRSRPRGSERATKETNIFDGAVRTGTFSHFSSGSAETERAPHFLTLLFRALFLRYGPFNSVLAGRHPYQFWLWLPLTEEES